MQKLQRVMGCSQEDLIRWLPLAMGSFYHSTNLTIDNKQVLKVPQPLVDIVALTKPPRKIALLNIPVMEISFSFVQSMTSNEREELIKRFDLYTRRGGG